MKILSKITHNVKTSIHKIARVPHALRKRLGFAHRRRHSRR